MNFNFTSDDFNRVNDPAGGVRPARDTGYRAPNYLGVKVESFSHPVISRGPDLPLEIHNNDLVDRGVVSKYGVNAFSIDTSKVRDRRRADIRRNVK